MDIWIVISGIDFENCNYTEGCYQSLASAKVKVEELKNVPCDDNKSWEMDYLIRDGKREDLSTSWSRGSYYIKIEEQVLEP